MYYDTKYVEKYLNIGDDVFVIVRDEQTNNLVVVKDIVKEIDNIAILSEDIIQKFNLTSETAWWYPDVNRVIGYIKPSNENQYGFIELPPEVIKDSKIVNQFIWIQNYSLGHADSLGDGVWLTKEEALKNL